MLNFWKGRSRKGVKEKSRKYHTSLALNFKFSDISLENSAIALSDVIQMSTLCSEFRSEELKIVVTGYIN